ncbi:CHAP domain-containing protein [Staphylococcus massiliensis]|uniref:Peptidase C51 domain-containing protein n=2 Tax=Staphylococcus massiliensis TaxID=555791 RepID=K9ASF1_9STAP|nr:CHAP domain-containing protein [Staphylococcus massiliensis]EKU48971.1 hypothetical protein C273_04170 [Staphylococcus massiliensis S46]MCG3399411.1 CHAP domain-containing protein [Staphylococcus massiliensis]MCG3411547.1 CHAP domain-containing protein [Staphylococcus massiliensis]PNZ96994.1 CHAP domain-containing protein [Staphylococcus massiliensis CCUG 55927]
MNKIATATIATAGIATFGMMQNEADAAEYNNGGYNPNDPTSYSYSYTIDNNDEYHFEWQGNWSPDQFDYGTNNSQQSYNSSNNVASANTASNATSNRSAGISAVSAPTTSSYEAPASNARSYNAQPAQSSNNGGVSISNYSGSSANLYTAGQCTWYVYDRVGGKISTLWGNANNWGSAAASEGFTVNNQPQAGSIMQSTQGAFGHVAYVESVNNDGSVTVSEMNYNAGPFGVSTRTIPASQAYSYNYIH